jgi:NAD(P) transhydrogenase subunit alpha
MEGKTMRIGVPKERLALETRAAATPKTVEQLLKLGFSVAVESGAGKLASFDDEAFVQAGAEIVSGDDVWQSDVILKVNAPDDEEILLLNPGTTLISFIWPAQNPQLMEKLAARNINVMAMDSVPRISRAQSLDALSSMANIAGYRAIVEAAHEFGRFFTGQITAAGKVPPAKVMVIGAGVAGLAAIGAANSLGAIVRAFDTRPEVKEQVQSMGAEFLELDFKEEAGSGDGYAKVMSEAFIKAEMALFAAQAKDVDIIVTTALIPGKPAPKLITREMVDSMKSGSVVVDLASQNGGNCEYTVPGQVVTTANGVKIIGYTDLLVVCRRSPHSCTAPTWLTCLSCCAKRKTAMSLSILMMSLSAALPWFARVKSPGPRHPFRYLLSRRRQRKRLKRQKQRRNRARRCASMR